MEDLDWCCFPCVDTVDNIHVLSHNGKNIQLSLLSGRPERVHQSRRRRSPPSGSCKTLSLKHGQKYRKPMSRSHETETSPPSLCVSPHQLRSSLQLIVQPSARQALIPQRQHPLQVSVAGWFLPATQPHHVSDLHLQPHAGVLPRRVSGDQQHVFTELTPRTKKKKNQSSKLICFSLCCGVNTWLLVGVWQLLRAESFQQLLSNTDMMRLVVMFHPDQSLHAQNEEFIHFSITTCKLISRL